jgi:outer membrane receptor protein involved in Fe transport
LALGSIGASLASPAIAAEAQPPMGLEEIIVTATRRTETNLQETPISVSAVTASDMNRMVAKDLSGIAALVPGFSAARVTAFNAANSPCNAYLNAKTLFNASLAWTSADGRYFARLYGRNLGDKRYRIASQSVATLWTHTQWGEPRNFGVQLGMKFGGTQ